MNRRAFFSLKVITIECFGSLKSLIPFAQILNHRGDSTKQWAGHVSKHFFLREDNIIGERVVKVRKRSLEVQCFRKARTVSYKYHQEAMHACFAGKIVDGI